MNILAVALRAFASNLGSISVSETERVKLEAAGMIEPTMQRYLVWRRATVLMVVIATLLSAGVATYRSVTDPEDQPNVFETVTEGLLKQIAGAVPAAGKWGVAGEASTAVPAEDDEPEEAQTTFARFEEALHLASLYVLPVAALLVVFLGDRMKLSFKVMLIAFAFSFFVPMLVQLCPWSWWGYVEPKLSPTSDPVGYARDQMEGMIEGIAQLVILLPAVLSLIPGVLRACLRIKTLLPQSLLPGWFIVTAAPLSALFTLVAFVAIDQFTSDPLLVSGLLLLAAAPLVYAFRARVFTRPLLSEEDYRRMRRTQQLVGGLTLLGGVLFVTYLATREVMGVHLVGADPKTALLRPIEVVEYLLEIVSRSMFVTALGADLFMRMNLTAWKQGRALGSSEGAAAYDGAMTALEGVV